MKIFISIASYQDFLLPTTIHSAYNQAKFKNNIRFGIVDQSDQKLDFSQSEVESQISYLHVNPSDARGPCWARAMTQSLMNDEDYFLQIDSHSVFEKDWDAYLIDYIQEIEKKHSKPVISGYPRGFEIVDLEKRLYKKKQADDDSTYVMVLDRELTFKDGHFSMQKAFPAPSREIFKGFLMSAGFIFSRRQFVEEVPYDPHLYFEGEETTLALRAFTNGYDIFHIPKTPLFHCYLDVSDPTRRPLHWDKKEQEPRTYTWSSLQDKSKNRIKNIIEGTLKGTYGLGSVRPLNAYKEHSGIDLLNRQIIDPDTAYNFTKHLTTEWQGQ